MSSNEEDQESDIYKETIKLKKPIHLSDVYADGATFEADLNQEPPDLERMKFDFDENILHKLQCGTYGQEFQDDEISSIGSNEDGLEPFEKLALNMEDLIADGGVKKRIVDHGYGDVVPPDAYVVFKYNGYQEYSDEPFDSSMFQNKPTKIHLGKGQLIPGMEIAVCSMKKKETSHFMIQSKYAYGELGCPPRIPANSTLLFEITIYDVLDAAAADAYSHLDDEQVTNATFDERYKAAVAFHAKANDSYKHEHYSTAKYNYRRGTWILESTKLENEEQEEKCHSLRLRMYTNCAMACLKLKDPRGACIQCRCALELKSYADSEKLAQVFYRFGEAKRLLHDYKCAYRLAHKASKLSSDSLIKELIERIHRDEKKSLQEDKVLYSSMLGIRKKEDIELDDKMKRMALVDEEFKSTLNKQIEQLIGEKESSTIPLRSNLTNEEVEYAKNAAAAANCSVELLTQGKTKNYHLFRPI